MVTGICRPGGGDTVAVPEDPVFGSPEKHDSPFIQFAMNQQLTIDLNADLGESYGPWKMGHDEAMLDIVSSANIACGFHAGGPSEMCTTLERCRDKGVAAGAHPGFADLRGFGRRRLPVTDLPALQADLIYQIGAFMGLAKAQGVPCCHIKLHGALSNMTCEDRALADICVQAIRQVAPEIPILAQASTHLEKAADGTGPVIREVFADREYHADGTLVSRHEEGAVINDAGRAAERVLKIIEEQAITARDGSIFNVQPESVCVHGDHPSAVRMAARIRQVLEEQGIAVRAG